MSDEQEMSPAEQAQAEAETEALTPPTPRPSDFDAFDPALGVPFTPAPVEPAPVFETGVNRAGEYIPDRSEARRLVAEIKLNGLNARNGAAWRELCEVVGLDE